MYIINWQKQDVLKLWKKIHKCAGIDEMETISGELKLIQTILTFSGGFNLSQTALSESVIDKTALKIFSGAVRHALKPFCENIQNTRPIFYDSGEAQFKNKIELISAININLTSLREVKKIPNLPSNVCTRIIQDREKKGPFKDITNLTKRIPEAKEFEKFIKSYAVFHPQFPLLNKNLRITGDFNKDFSLLLSLDLSKTPKKKLLNTLEYILGQCREDTNPYTRYLYSRINEDFKLPALESVGSIGCLPGKHYLDALRSILSEAKSTIEICMFHISLGGATSETKKLLDLIVDKKAEGVEVKVLMDQDNKDDPYLSTIINSKAKSFLKDNNVDVKYDKTDSLLHSKFVIVDNQTTIIGSHNWTGVSFKETFDLSISIHSPGFAYLMKNRFDLLWSQS